MNDRYPRVREQDSFTYLWNENPYETPSLRLQALRSWFLEMLYMNMRACAPGLL